MYYVLKKEALMATAIIMPRQGQSVESCIITKWNVKKGDKVQVGDVLFTYETDKATFDEESKVEGTVLEIFFEEGDDVPCLTNVLVIGNEGESVAEFDPREQGSTDGDKAEEEKKADVIEIKEPTPDTTAPATIVNTEGRLKISPRAKNLAIKSGIDPRYAEASGPEGRIIERDIISLREKGPIVTSAALGEFMASSGNITQGTGLGGRVTTADLSAGINASPVASDATAMEKPVAEYTEVKLTNIRKVIAKAMHNSLSNSAQLTLNTTFDATDILAYRKKLKEAKERIGLENITINDIILFAVSRTIQNHKDLNAHYLDDKMLIFNNVHLGIAVDTERGLMVPTLFNADTKSLNQISKEAKALAEGAQKGTVNPDLLKGASFTITNLGTLDIESFTPVINPPQTGILGVNTIVQRVKEVKGEYVYYPAMGLSLTFDHRAIDGAPAARFLKELKTNLENFSILLAK